MQRLIDKKLQAWKQSFSRKPLLIRGVRQCGKTTSILKFGKSFRRCHVLNFEKNRSYRSIFDNDLNPRKILSDIELLLDRSIDIHKDLLFFDEIQACPEAVTALKYFFEDMPELALCCAGSHVGVTLNPSSFPVGKVAFIDMFPMNFAEFLLNFSERLHALLNEKIIDEKSITTTADGKLFDTLKKYWITGGMPEAVSYFLNSRESNHDAYMVVREIHQALINGYLSDFAKHCGGLNAQHIHLVFNNIPEQLQQIKDGASKRYQFRGIIPHRSKYTQLSGPIEWLAGAGLALKINQLEKIGHPVKAYARENFFRLFLMDVGLLNTMLEMPLPAVLTAQPNNYKGFIAENYIAQEIVSQGIPIYTFNEKRSEVEFILNYRDQIIPVEVKAGKNLKSQSLTKFKERYSPQQSIKFSAKPLRFENGQISAPLYLSSFLPSILHCPRNSPQLHELY
jgi:predicted AAA+ superfamily ATPase